MPVIPRVAHVVISLAHGGLERLVVDWTNARNRRCPESTQVWCLDEAGDLAEQVEGGAVRCFYANRSRWPWDVRTVREMRQECRRQIILHSHTLASQQYSVLAAWRSGIRHVHTQHGAHVHLRSPVNRWRSRVLCGMTDGLVAVAEPVAEVMCRIQGVPRERIKVVPNGTTPHPAYPPAAIKALRESLGLPQGVRIVGAVGRLDFIKGYDRLLKAMGDVSASGVNCRLLLVGDGPARPDLERQATAAGLSGRVVFAGFQPESRKYLELMDLFVLPSRSEGLSVALLEAMAAGVPVLVTDAGSNREVVAGGEAGAILPEDERQWPAAIASAITSPETACAKATVARNRVATSYSLEATLDQYEACYDSLS